MSAYLIQQFDMRFAAPECHPDADWHRVFVDLHDDIAAALPYLNAELEGAEYSRNAQVLLWRTDEQKYAFRPREIAIAPVMRKEEAQKLVVDIVAAVNTIWARRAEIEPRFEEKKPSPNLLYVYKLLPRTDCGDCGSPSCMAFAAIVRHDPAKASLCPHISEEDCVAL